MLPAQRPADDKERFRRRLELAAELATCLGTDRIDLLLLDEAPPLLGRHVVSAGRLLFVRDPAALHAYVRDVQLRAADLEPFLARTRRLKLESLQR